MNNREITDHSLHLLVDGQLDSASKKILKKQIQNSPELQQKLKNITEIKELISLAYVQEKPKPLNSVNLSMLKPASMMGIAASMIMTIGLMIGWLAHQQYENPVYVVAKSEIRQDVKRQQIPLEINLQNARKYMLHFDSMSEDRFENALIEANSLLHSYAKSGLPIKVDLLFDQQAVEIFEPRHAAQIKQLKGLINEFENIQFYACSESLKMFLGDIEMPQEMGLFHSSEVVKEMIPKRMEQGWVYIKA